MFATMNHVLGPLPVCGVVHYMQGAGYEDDEINSVRTVKRVRRLSAKLREGMPDELRGAKTEQEYVKMWEFICNKLMDGGTKLEESNLFKRKKQKG